MTVDIKKLTVNTEEQRKGWIELLQKCSDYHYDMSGQFAPEIITPNKNSDMEKVSQIHRAWGKAIYDAILIIDMWQVEEEEEE